MSMVGFKSSNHPQQTSKRGARDDVDDRGTTWDFIKSLEARVGAGYFWGPFDLDVAASEHNAKAPTYFTREQDGLLQDWRIGGDGGGDLNVWCNPPYSDCGAWVRKAWSEWAKPWRPHRIAMLLPANRVEQGWWQECVEPFRDRPESPLRVEFLRGRMRFERPDWTPGPKGDRPPFGCCLLIWETPIRRVFPKSICGHCQRPYYHLKGCPNSHGAAVTEAALAMLFTDGSDETEGDVHE